MPPSVTGMRASNLLKQRFQQLGGTILVSDTWWRAIWKTIM
jgi:anaerobic glycerol-3-phosphate dehydrogenase